MDYYCGFRGFCVQWHYRISVAMEVLVRLPSLVHDPSDFLSLPETHYSLLVSECEKWVPEFADLIDQFNFIPNWRIDDLMVSYAPPGGSVGPHSDEYDVLLYNLFGETMYIVDKEKFILETGDLLHIKKGQVHQAITIKPRITFSLGVKDIT